jgi:glycosyltransferase involved in cell wall biosynthesis
MWPELPDENWRRCSLSGSALFIAADLPYPADGGGRIATLRVLEAMAEDRPVDLIALADVDDPEVGDHLRSLCRNVTVVPHPFTLGRHRTRQMSLALRSVVSPTPYRVAKFRSRPLARTIAAHKADREYELIHHDQFGVAAYRDPGYPSTLTTQNVESEVFRLGAGAAQGRARRAWAALETRKLRRVEPKLDAAFDHVFTLSRLDASLLDQLGVPGATVLPMPVDAPIDPPDAELPGHTLLTMGSMSWFGVEDGLLWFFRDVWPLVQARVPDVHWQIVGSNAGPAIQRLGLEEGITVRGYVEDIRDEVQASRVCLVPLHVAGGIRIKLLELMADARPSVATTVGAQGIDFEDGQGVFRRDDPVAFADATVRLLTDDGLWRATGHAGWRFVRAHHTRAATSLALREGIEMALARHRDRHASPSATRGR